MGPVTDTHRITYKENVALAIQEKRAVFEAGFDYTSGISGKQTQVLNVIGKSEARVDAPEGGDTPDIDSQHEPIWVRPTRLDWGKVLRKEDSIKALTDYKSEYVQVGASAMTRGKNAIMAAAVFGPKLIGNEVPSSTAWAGRTVAIDVGGTGSTGFNVKKILRGIQLMETDDVEVNEEQLVIGADPVEIEQLWGDITFVSKDYRKDAQLDDMNKRVMAIFGIPIITTKRFADAAANQSVAGLWCKSAMKWGDAMPLDINSAPNPQKQFREQVYMENWIAATRTFDAKAVKILNLY
jgi:hypothetical protein